MDQPTQPGGQLTSARLKKDVKYSNQVPEEILSNEELNRMIGFLPSNYNFEIHKSVYQIQKNGYRKSLLLYSCTISDILSKFCGVEVVVMGDVTYGACCIDDYTAASLGCDFIIHYGHSCLVPINITKMRVLYVFVSISFDLQHLASLISSNFSSSQTIGLLGTVQFVALLPEIMALLPEFRFHVPQARPLSPGEVLGCTAPKMNVDCYIYLGDGRFHLEAIMIANPSIPAFKYDPYSKVLSKEFYDIRQMKRLRLEAIETARQAKRVGLILGTLGRQGSASILQKLQQKLVFLNIQHFVFLISEISPAKLAMFQDIDVWIQVACPRLSIDWGYAFEKPLLSPYEASVVFGSVEWQEIYPMDYYAKDSLGNWTVNHKENIK